MNGTLSLAMVLLTTVLLSAHPTSCMPTHAPQMYPDFIHTSNMPQAQEGFLNEPLAENEELGAAENEELGAIIQQALDIYRNRETPIMQADFGGFANGGTFGLNALTDELQNILNSQPSTSTSPESVAEVQLWRRWRNRLRNFIRRVAQFFLNRQNPRGTSSIQTDLGGPAEGGADLDALTNELLQNILNSQLSTSSPTESVAEIQLRRYWPSIRNFLHNIISPRGTPCQQPDNNALAENLEDVLTGQILTGERQEGQG